MRGLKNKVVLISGGLGDLGFASAQRLAAEGCQIALLDRHEHDARKAATIGAIYVQVDVGDESHVERACLNVREQLGPVEVLVNSAARFIFKGIDATADDWEQITRVNLVGASLLAKYCVPMMKEGANGSIINFSSVSGFVGQANFATYNATKFALRGLTKCWAQDLAPFGIRVNTVCPGYVYTSAFVKSCNDLGLDIDEEDRRASAMHLLNRQARPEEIAAAVAFLASEDASFITGTDLVVDGGYLAK